MTRDRAALLATLAQGLTAAGDSVPGQWDGFSAVAEVTALGVRVTGFRYREHAPGLPMLLDAAVTQTIADLRGASPGPNGETFDVYVARLDRSSGQIVDQAFTLETGAGYKVTASNVSRIATLVRPGLPFLSPSSATPPSTPVAGLAFADAQPRPEMKAGLDETAADGSSAPVLEPVAASEISAPEATSLTANAQPQLEAQPAGEAEPAVEAHSPIESQSESESAPAPPPLLLTKIAPPTQFAAPPPPPPTQFAAPPPPPPPPTQARPTEFAALTEVITQWPELGDSDWSAFAAAVSYSEGGPSALGFRYTASGAVPTFVGGAFLSLLRDLREASRGPTGELPGAALVRIPARDAQAQVRFIFGPAAAQITWTAADETMAERLRPETITAPAALAARPEADLLHPGALLDRVKADIAASLRGRDGWRSFALGVDIPRNRAVAFVYTEDGTPVRYQPPLSPLADLSDLRAQTARPDGSQWAGVVVHAWRTGGERVDLNFQGAAGIGDFLDRGPEAAAMTLRPHADPPPSEPRPPWPASGGHLDTQALVSAVSSAVLTSPELIHDDWDRLAVVLQFDDTVPTVSALRFRGDAPGVVTAIPNPGPIGKLRRSNPNDVGWLWDACVLRGFRGAKRLDPEFRFGADADEFRVDTDSITRIGDRLRPV